MKYVEDLDLPEARHRQRYEDVADEMGAFVAAERHRLRRAPLEQFWRDHLLAGSLALDVESGFHRGTFAVVFPSGNTIVAAAADDYRTCLTSESSFRAWTLEQVADAIVESGAGPWALEVRQRYLG